jgi:uncharacterized protein YkwD
MRLTIITAAAALALACAPAHAAAPDPLLDNSQCANSDSRQLSATQTATAVNCLVNAARAHAGLRTLRTSTRLLKVARKRRDLVVRCDTFSHRPCGHWITVDAGPYRHRARWWEVGENLQWSAAAGVTPREIVENWLASPPHRKNLLGPHWRDMALSTAQDVQFQGNNDATVWVQWFGRRVTTARTTAR